MCFYVIFITGIKVMLCGVTVKLIPHIRDKFASLKIKNRDKACECCLGVMIWMKCEEKHYK